MAAKTKKLYSFDDHPEHKEQLKGWADKWIANALRVNPMDQEDRNLMVLAMDGLYKAAKLEPPTRHIFVKSPMTGAIATTTSSAVWWVKENAHECKKIFSTDFTNLEIAEAVRIAVTEAVNLMWKENENGANSENPEGNKHFDTDLINAIKEDVINTIVAATDMGVIATTEDNSSPSKPVKDLSQFFLQCLPHWYKFYNGGNHWSGWCSYISFFRHVAKLDLPEYEVWQHYESAAIHGSYRFMHSKFWIVSDFPEIINKDAGNLPHADGQPQMKWRDGWATYYLHGVRCPEWLVMTDVDKLDPNMIMGIKNVDQRREGIRKIGVERCLSLLGAKKVDSWSYETENGQEHPYELYEMTLPGASGVSKALKMRNPSIGVYHVEFVWPGVTTCKEALAWRNTNSQDKKVLSAWKPPKVLT